MRGIDEEAAIERYSKDYVKSKEDATKGISKDQHNEILLMFFSN